jgi:hypothetical protein
VRVFVTRNFDRWLRNERLDDTVLFEAATEVVLGHVEGDLGGFLFKKRIARAGSGKSGGYRTIIGYRKGRTDRIVFLYGYAKNVQDALTPRDEKAFAKAARGFVEADDATLDVLLAEAKVREVEDRE